MLNAGGHIDRCDVDEFVGCRLALAGPSYAGPMETRERIAYPILMILGALDAAGYSVIAPVTPSIARETGAGPALVGALVASFPMGIMVGSILAAQGVKRGHSTAVLLASLGLAALGSLAFVAGDSLEIYFVGRLVMGLGSGGVWIGAVVFTAWIAIAIAGAAWAVLRRDA